MERGNLAAVGLGASAATSALKESKFDCKLIRFINFVSRSQW